MHTRCPSAVAPKCQGLMAHRNEHGGRAGGLPAVSVPYPATCAACMPDQGGWVGTRWAMSRVRAGAWHAGALGFGAEPSGSRWGGPPGCLWDGRGHPAHGTGSVAFPCTSVHTRQFCCSMHGWRLGWLVAGPTSGCPVLREATLATAWGQQVILWMLLLWISAIRFVFLLL